MTNKLFYMRPNTISSADDGITNDVVYHNVCWVVAQRNVELRPPAEGFIKTLSGVELISFK